MDVQKQVDYWVTSGEEDFAAAKSLLEKGHFRHCLFFAHLAIEKMLKAHVTRKTSDIPPRTHNLLRLAEIADLKLDTEQQQFLREFGVYQLEGRYPDSEESVIPSSLVKAEIVRASRVLSWLTKQL
jgi:HEPN domain-containing protein